MLKIEERKKLGFSTTQRKYILRIEQYYLEKEQAHLEQINELLKKTQYKGEDKIAKAISFENLFQQFIEFSVPTFKYATAISSLEKLDEEIKEIVNEVQHGHENLVEEYVDCIMCLLDSAARFGIKISDLKTSFENKLGINKKRTWVKNDNNTYSHK